MNRKFFDQKSLALSFICAMVLVALEVSPWMAFFAVGLIIWKWGVENLKWKALSRKLTGILSIVILVQVLIQYRTLIGQEPSYTFLLGLSGLRIMDYSNDRDHKFIVLLGFVLVSIKALFSLDIYWIIPSGLAFAGLWYSLLPDQLPQRGRVLAKIFLLSAPLALILFFAFPRLVLPWAMSRGGNYGQIGFSDELNPGRIAEIASTTSVAFRAKLSELPLVNSNEMYWRGSVLTQSKGLSWRPTRMVLADNPQKFEGLLYEVALEPQASLFLFTLDGTHATRLEAGTVLPLRSGIFRASRPLMATTVYRGAWSTKPDTEVPEQEYLEVPNLSKRVREWVEKTKTANATLEERAEALKRFYIDHDFTYTLSPGVYGSTANDLESFLFLRRKGFCEHFAGSYATLARALGIPSRVVIGYQGGRYNPLGDFWKISQKDAHAWVEIYLKGTWQRVDPTSWVAPLRLTIGADEFFSMSEEDQKAFAKSIKWRPNADSSLIWDRITFLAEDLNYRWTYFLLDFDRGAQQGFWSQLADAKLQISIGFICILALCFLLFRSLFRNKRLQSEDQLLFSQIAEWGRLNHLPQHTDEAPLQYLARLGREVPKLAPALEDISVYIDQKIYAGISQPQSASHLAKKWREATRA